MPQTYLQLHTLTGLKVKLNVFVRIRSTSQHVPFSHYTSHSHYRTFTFVLAANVTSADPSLLHFWSTTFELVESFLGFGMMLGYAEFVSIIDVIE